MIWNNNLLEIKTEESTCDMDDCCYPNYVNEDESNDIRAESFENNRGEFNVAKNHTIQVLNGISRTQMSNRVWLPQIQMTKSNKHIV